MEQSWDNLDLFLFGIGGILIYFLVKINLINRKMNGGFKYRDFLRIEWPSILLAIVVVVMCVFLRHELSDAYVPKYMGAAFVAIGACAQLVVYKFLGRAESIIGSKDDEKDIPNNKTDTDGTV